MRRKNNGRAAWTAMAAAARVSAGFLALAGSGVAGVAPPAKQKIAFASDRDGNREVYVSNADGSGEPVNLSNHAAYDTDPTFSPPSKAAPETTS